MSSTVFAVHLHDFHDKVIAASHQTPVLVDFWAEWCAPCRIIAPVLEAVIEAHAGGLLLGKLEVDEGENMKLAGHYRVRGFPTVVLFVDGEERGRFSGAKSKSAIESFLAEHHDRPAQP
jgi:putative thioredoxin